MTYPWTDEEKKALTPGTPIWIQPKHRAALPFLALFVADVAGECRAQMSESVEQDHDWEMVSPCHMKAAPPLSTQERELLNRRSAELGKAHSALEHAKDECRTLAKALSFALNAGIESDAKLMLTHAMLGELLESRRAEQSQGVVGAASILVNRYKDLFEDIDPVARENGG